VAAPTYTVLGWRSGEKAAEFIKNMPEPEVDPDQVKAEEERVLQPISEAEGFTWQEVNIELNQIMEEYKKYVVGFNPPGGRNKMSTTGFNNCLDQLAKLKEAKMKAKNPHELVRCNEVMNLIDVGTLMVRAAFEEDQFKRGNWFLGKLEDDKPVFRLEPIKVKYPPQEAA